MKTCDHVGPGGICYLIDGHDGRHLYAPVEPDIPGVPSPYTEGARIMLAGETPDGWEVRGCTDVDFQVRRDGWGWSSDAIVEARPIPVPDVVVTLPRDVAEKYVSNFQRSDVHDRSVVAAIFAALDGDQ